MTEILPSAVQNRNGRWQINHPALHAGGALFAITAEWCPHCTQLKGAIVPQAQRFNPFLFFWMDGDKTDAARTKTQQMGIQGFPTIYYVGKNGYLQQYDGDRSPQQLARVFHR